MVRDIFEDKERFVKVLKTRIEHFAELIRKDELAEAYACFDILKAINSGFQGGLSETDIEGAYPFEDWRDDQVMVPRKIIQVISDGWDKYTTDTEVKTLEEAYGIAAKSKGASPQKRRIKTLNRDQKLSNAVAEKLLAAELFGIPTTQEAEFTAVSEENDASYDAVKKAYQKHKSAVNRERDQILKELRAKYFGG